MQKLTLRETQFLIVNKPLGLVNLKHSKHNKKIVQTALAQLWRHPSGTATFEILREFLTDVAPKYQLNKSQDGVRCFLLREMENLGRQKERAKSAENRESKTFFAGLLGFFRMAS